MSDAGLQVFQQGFSHIHCFGCGADNREGLQIRSYWLEPGVISECRYQPLPHHCAGPVTCVNGGIIATVVDCHAICTAMAAAYLAAGRPLDSQPAIQYATATLSVSYLKPARMGQELVLTAQILAVEGKKTRLAVSVSSGGDPCARAEVLAVRAPADWQA